MAVVFGISASVENTSPPQLQRFKTVSLSATSNKFYLSKKAPNQIKKYRNLIYKDFIMAPR
jgi:hypothetical protein